MAEETIKKPEPPRVENWRIPKVMRIEGDGMDPRNTKLFDAETDEELKGLPVAALQFNVTADEPNSMVITLANVALRAEVHHVHVDIDARDLHALARMNGYRIEPVPAFPARIVAYGPAEHQVIFRDLPDLKVTKANPANQTTLRMAEEALFRHLQGLADDRWPTPVASEPQDDEFLVQAHAPNDEPEFDEVG